MFNWMIQLCSLAETLNLIFRDMSEAEIMRTLNLISFNRSCFVTASGLRSEPCFRFAQFTIKAAVPPFVSCL